MRDLIGRVAVRDDDAATALRVIAHFDELVDRDASSASILRSAAALANSPVGMHDAAIGTTTRFDAPGMITSTPESPDPLWPREAVDSVRGTSVWIERAGDSGPLDQLILERCAHALRTGLRVGTGSASSEELMRIVCDAQVSRAERGGAWTALHLPEQVTLFASAHPLTAAMPCVLLDQTWVSVAAADGEDAVHQTSIRTGAARAHVGGVASALANARTALALAVHPGVGEPLHVAFEDLGALADLFRAVPVTVARASEEIIKLERLRTERPWVPSVICQLASGATLRAAAQYLHLHHSTLQDREQWLQDRLDYQLRSNEGRMRSAAAWQLWRISGLLHDA